MHGHMAFFGAYAMINLAMITYTLPAFAGVPDEERDTRLGLWAFWLMIGAMFLSLGLLISILTRSQIVAAITSFVLMFLLFIVPVFSESQVAGSRILQCVAAYTNLWNHALDFSKGIVDSRNLVYYATSTALMLFLSVWTLAAKKGQ